jgi:hypothetical protein
MEILLWIGGLLVVGVAGYLALLRWALHHTPEGGKSINTYYDELRTLPCEPSVTNSIIAALNVIPAYLNSHPEIDEEDESFLRHIDEYFGVIRIRTREMSREDMEPIFSISTPHHSLGDVEVGRAASAVRLHHQLRRLLRSARGI